MIPGEEITNRCVLEYATLLLKSVDRLRDRTVRAVRFNESGHEAEIMLSDGSTQKTTGLFASKMRNMIV